MTPAAILPALAAVPDAAVRAGLRPVRFVGAQRALLEKVLAETAVSRTPSRPSLLSYGEAWARAFERWLERIVSDRPGAFESLGRILVIAAVLSVAVAIGLLVFALVRKLAAGRRPSSAMGHPATAAAPGAAPARDVEAWKREIERRLQSGDVAGALEALWWWLARSLAGSKAEASWTTRELVARAKRPDLLALVPDLDILMYAPRRPAVADVTACRDRLEKVVA